MTLQLQNFSNRVTESPISLVPRVPHYGKGFSEIIIKHPTHVQYILDSTPRSKAFKELQDDIQYRIDRFDQKPYTSRCTSCTKEATRFSIYRESTECVPWCKECDPTSLGAEWSNLVIVSKYDDIYWYFDKNADMIHVILQMLRAKGYVGKPTKKDLEKFLTGQEYPPEKWKAPKLDTNRIRIRSKKSLFMLG